MCDFAFVGTGYASRIAFMEAMDLAGLDVVLAGNWQQLAEHSPLHAHVAHDERPLDCRPRRSLTTALGRGAV